MKLFYYLFSISLIFVSSFLPLNESLSGHNYKYKEVELFATDMQWYRELLIKIYNSKIFARKQVGVKVATTFPTYN